MRRIPATSEGGMVRDTPGGIQWVLPSIDPRYRRECLMTMHPHIAQRTLVIDNTHHNRGVPASWNLGAQAALNVKAAWLVICAEAVRFGPAGGEDLEAELAADPGSPWADIAGPASWHLVAFRADTLRRVGRFDENFWPAYMEDSDYLIRLDLAGYPSPRENDLPHRWIIGVDAYDLGTENALRKGLVTVDFGQHTRYWINKWGATPPKAAWRHPFNNPDNHWDYWPPAHDRTGTRR